MIVPTITFGDFNAAWGGGGEAHARQQTLVDAQRGTRLGARKTQTPFNARDT